MIYPCSNFLYEFIVSPYISIRAFYNFLFIYHKMVLDIVCKIPILLYKIHHKLLFQKSV